MKKLVITFLACLLIGTPVDLMANRYKLRPSEGSSQPIRTPDTYSITAFVDDETGDLSITPNYDITGLNITITGNGVTYLNTTVSLSANQSYTDCLDYLDEGTYILTMSTIDGVIAQYEITVEDD